MEGPVPLTTSTGARKCQTHFGSPIRFFFSFLSFFFTHYQHQKVSGVFSNPQVRHFFLFFFVFFFSLFFFFHSPPILGFKTCQMCFRAPGKVFFLVFSLFLFSTTNSGLETCQTCFQVPSMLFFFSPFVFLTHHQHKRAQDVPDAFSSPRYFFFSFFHLFPLFFSFIHSQSIPGAPDAFSSPWCVFFFFSLTTITGLGCIRHIFEPSMLIFFFLIYSDYKR